MSSVAKSKHVISISLGSSKRDAKAHVRLGDTELFIERRGTDGDFAKARQLMEAYDGKVDAIGLGGTDLYVYAGEERYTFRESAKLVVNVKHTPVLDGSGLKNSLERRLVEKLASEKVVDFENSKVFLVCGVDRFGMAQAMQKAGAKLTFGDLLFGFGVDKPLRSLEALAKCARLLAPVVTRLPVSWLYPMGEAQQKRTPKFSKYFLENDTIAGDFHFIRKFMPDTLPGKTIITNTVTSDDRAMLKKAGVKLLITTTPCLEGRSFGTNVMEAMLVAVKGAQTPLTAAEYIDLLEEYKIESSIEYLNI